MGCTWLKEKMDRAGIKQEALATAVGGDARILRRWQNCQRDASKKVPYEALARALDVSEVQLCEDHARDLEAAGLLEHAQAARCAAEAARRKLRFPPVDPRPIQERLEACAGSGLVSEIQKRDADLTGPREQGTKIAALLGSGHLDDLFSLVNPPLGEAIDRAQDAQAKEALRRFLLSVVHASAAREPGIGRGGLYEDYLGDRAWPFRAMIDSSQRLNGMRTVRPHPREPQYRLDDGRDSTRAVKSGEVTQLSADGRVHELVREFAATLAVEQQTPSVSDAKAFERHCRLVNAALAVHNHGDGHVFGLWQRGNQEAEEVKARLMALLPSLRLFDVDEAGAHNEVLRVDQQALEAWYSFYLNRLGPFDETHFSGLAGRPGEAGGGEDPPPSKERAAMSPTNDPSVSLHVHLSQGDDSSAAVAGHDASSHVQATQVQQLAEVLERLLRESSGRAAETGELRRVVRSAQSELEEQGRVTGETKGLLERAAKALPAADKLVSMASKAVALIGQVGGLLG